MLSFSKTPARPQSQSRKPSYPRQLGLGALLLLAACGGTAIEGTSEGAAGTVAQAGSGGGELGGAAPFPIDAQVPETGGAGGTAGAGGEAGHAEAGTGGYNAEGGSMGGGAPIEFEAGVGGAAGEGGAEQGGSGGEAQAGSGGGDPAGDIAEPFDAGAPETEPSSDGFAPYPYEGP